MFIDTPQGLRWQRRLERDKRERGRDNSSIESFWVRAEETFQEWGRAAFFEADVVVDGSQSPRKMMNDLLTKVALD